MKSKLTVYGLSVILLITACTSDTQKPDSYQRATQAFESAKHDHNISFSGPTVKEVVETEDAIIGKEFLNDSLLIDKKELAKGYFVGLIYLEPKSNNKEINKGVYRAYYRMADSSFLYEVLGNDNKVVHTAVYKLPGRKPAPAIPHPNCDQIERACYDDFNLNVAPALIAEANRKCETIKYCLACDPCIYILMQFEPTSWRCPKWASVSPYLDLSPIRVIRDTETATNIPDSN